MKLTFTVPGQPQGKGRPRVGKIGNHARLFTPQKTVNFEGLVAHSARLAMAGAPLIECAALVRIEINCQIPASWSARKQLQALHGFIRPTTKPDIDNVEKAIFDGLNGVVWRDDVQVVQVTKSKRYSAVPGVTVWIEALTDVTTPQPKAAPPERELSTPF